MKKNAAIPLSIIAILVGALLIKSLFIKPNITTTLNTLRREEAVGLDSLNSKLAAENRFFDSIQYLISSGRLQDADDIINHLLVKGSRNSYYWALKGQIFDGRQQYDSAIYYYNFSILLDPYSIALNKRATLFIKKGQYDSAIQDYRKAYEHNYDYSYQLATTFAMEKQKDSALKYYKIYSVHYPNSAFQKK